jgi:hypothetical protein
MLIIWHTELVIPLRSELTATDPRVSFWPKGSVIRPEDPVLDWWISFSRAQYGVIWVLRHPDYSEIIYAD